MTVEELENEFILGQKYAIELTLCHTQPFEGEPFEEYDTIHFVVGEPKRNIYLHDNIRYIRSVGNEIYIAIAREV